MQKVDTVHLAETVDPTNLPFAHPGREVLALPRSDSKQRREVNAGSITVYGSIKDIGIGGAVRVNLFAEIMGERQHVASAFVTPGDPPAALITASGIVADSWHLLAQSTETRLQLHATMGSIPCCAEPRVRVNKANLNPPSAVADAGQPGAREFAAPPMVPWGRENGQWNGFNGIGGGTFTFLPGSRLTHIRAMTAAAGAPTIQINDNRGNVVLSAAYGADQLVEWFPNGDLPAASLTFVDMAFIDAEAVR